MGARWWSRQRFPSTPAPLDICACGSTSTATPTSPAPCCGSTSAAPRTWPTTTSAPATAGATTSPRSGTTKPARCCRASMTGRGSGTGWSATCAPQLPSGPDPGPGRRRRQLERPHRPDRGVLSTTTPPQGGATMRADDSSTTWRWGVHRLGVLGLVGTLLAVMLASSAAATGAPRAGAADPPPYLANATDPAVTTLAADLGISIREAQRRMGWQEPAMEMAGELERALGDRYGDLWFDPADGGRVKVGIVGGDTAGLAARLIARRKLAAVTDLVPMRHSYAELKQAAAWLTAETTRANPR